MYFADKLMLFLIVLIVPAFIYFLVRRRMRGSINFSTVKNLKVLKTSTSLRFRHVPMILRSGVLVLLIVGLARPQQGIEETKITTEGIDIILALDVSTSMLAEDFTWGNKRYNRLHVAKKVVKEFIEKRENDRIGTVVFARRAYTLCPPTQDYGVVLQFLERAEIGMIEDGTAIGSAIASSLNRLRDQEGKSRVIILLTDGINNAGRVDPIVAAELAKALEVKIYAVGAGTRGRVPYPVQDFFGNTVYQWVNIDLDEASLREIARITDGSYFRATDTESLRDIYDQIDTMEKTEVEVSAYMEYNEVFYPFVLAALLLLCSEVILAHTRFRTIP